MHIYTLVYIYIYMHYYIDMMWLITVLHLQPCRKKSLHRKRFSNGEIFINLIHFFICCEIKICYDEADDEVQGSCRLISLFNLLFFI